MITDESSKGGLFLGETRLYTYASPELSNALEQFYNRDARRKLGGSVLALKSVKSLSVYKQLYGAENDSSRMVSMARIAEADHVLQMRRDIRPLLLPEVQAKRHVPRHDSLVDQHGLELLFTAQIDEQTNRLLGGIALVNEHRQVTLRTVISRDDLNEPRELLAARDAIKKLFGDSHTTGTMPVRTNELHFTRVRHN